MIKIKTQDYNFMRLNKYLAKSGIASRRKSDELIKMATTTVNSEIILDPAYDVKESDEIRYDGRLLRIDQEKVVIMFNKPKNVITSVNDPFNRRTVMDYIYYNKRLVPVGRLDKDSTGLLLLTNDGDLHYYLTHPKNKIIREYDIVIDSLINPKKINIISKGINIGDGEFGRAKVVIQKMIKGRCHVKLILRQGKKREIRRIFNRLKIKLYTLHRVSFGGINLGGLKESEFRLLNDKEIRQLKVEMS
jgi:23S rRNA pseudouridine2605 synthase